MRVQSSTRLAALAVLVGALACAGNTAREADTDVLGMAGGDGSLALVNDNQLHRNGVVGNTNIDGADRRRRMHDGQLGFPGGGVRIGRVGAGDRECSEKQDRRPSPDALPAHGRVEVDRGLAGELVGRAGPVGPRVGVADHVVVGVDGDQQVRLA